VQVLRLAIRLPEGDVSQKQAHPSKRPDRVHGCVGPHPCLAATLDRAARGFPAILAEVKISAVINVGTATLGVLIGAGIYGQPILTGIRLDDMDLILQGAVPAAVMALLVQGLFELAERRLIPKGLRQQ
jgi:hypothetical protein